MNVGKINKNLKKKMKLIKQSFAVVAMTLCLGQSAFASAITKVWAVSSTGLINCGAAPHGLWTNSLNAGASACNDYYDIDGGSTLTEFDDGTAVLEASATNPDGIVADIDITFGSFSETHSPVKTGGGPELPSWYYYTTIESGNITIEGVDYDIGLHGDYALQIGDGANDKTSAFGASAWIDATGGKYDGGHWDLNLELTAVPVPAAVWLFGTGLLGLVGAARRKV